MSIPSPNRPELWKRHLPKARQWLLEQCQTINHGSITFYTRGGEPDLSQSHRTVRILKVAPEANGPRPEAASADFALRSEHVALLSQLARLPDGTCVKVKIAYGLPGTTIDIEEEHMAA